MTIPNMAEDPLEFLKKAKQKEAALLRLGASDDDEEYVNVLKSSARGREYHRESWRAKQLAKTEEELANPGLTPSAKQSLMVLRDYIKSPEYGKLPADRSKITVENEDGMVVSGSSDRPRSFASGWLTSPLQLLDLPLAVVQKLGVEGPVTKIRELLAEGQAMAREGTDARTPGLEGAILEFVGGLANPLTLKGYGKAAEVAGKVEAGAARAVGLKGVANAIQAGQGSASAGVRAATNVATGLPVNVAQSWAQMDGATTEEKLGQLAFGVAADALGGAAFGRPAVRNSFDIPPRTVDDALPKAASTDAQAIIEAAQREAELTAQRKAVEAESKLYESTAKTQAAAEWQAANIGKKWRDLSKEDRVAVITEWKKEHSIDWWRAKQEKVAPPTEASTDVAAENPVVAAAVDAATPVVVEPPTVVDPAVPPKSELELLQEQFAAKRASIDEARAKVMAPTVDELLTPDMRVTAAKHGDITAVPTLEDVYGALRTFRRIETLPIRDRLAESNLAELRRAHATIQTIELVSRDAPEMIPFTESTLADVLYSAREANAFVSKVEADNVQYGNFIRSYNKSVAPEASAPQVEARQDAELATAREEARTQSDAALQEAVAQRDASVTPIGPVADAVPVAQAEGLVAKNDIPNPMERDDSGAAPLLVRAGETVSKMQVKLMQQVGIETVPVEAIQKSMPSPPPAKVKPPVDPRIALEKQESKLLDKMQKLESKWQKANPGKAIRHMLNWDDAEYLATKQQLNTVVNALDDLPEAPVSTVDALPEGTIVRPEPIVTPESAPEAVKVKKTAAQKDLAPKQIDVKRARKPKELKDDELQPMIEDIQSRIANAGDKNVVAEYSRLLEKVVTEQVERQAARQLNAQANMPPGVGGAGLGFAYGVMTTEENDPDATTKIAMWTLAGAAAGYGVQRIAHNKQVKREVSSRINRLFPGQEAMAKQQVNVVGIGDKEGVKVPFTTMMRNFYNGTVRRIASFENLMGKIPVQKQLPLANNPVKLSEHFNRSIARTESWQHNAVVIDGLDGEPIYVGPALLGMEVKPAQKILAMVENDKEGLGKVMVALTSLELHGRGMENLPYEPSYATLVISNAPQNYIDAAREFRKFNLAMLKVMQIAGRITESTFNVLAQEQWYAPLYRNIEGGPARNIRDLQNNRITVRNPLQARQHGSASLDVINPVDQTLTLLPYVLRHQEYSQFVQSTLDVIRAQPGEVQRRLMKRVKSTDVPAIAKIEQEAKELRLSLGIGPEEADRLIAFRDEGTSAAGGGGYLTHWENGALSTYKVDDVIFDTAKSLLPFERDVYNNIVFRSGREVTRVATKGIVTSPAFIAKQFIIDTLDAAMTSKYGFRPGIDSVRGWWSIVSRNPDYLRVMDMGGLGAVQSLPYQTAEGAQKMFAAEGRTALAVSWNHMKELHPIEAYKALALPVAEASRMGEALRALDHKASTLEAVFAAREVGFNVSMEGSFTTIRALHQLTLFTRPGIQAADALARAAARDPIKFLAKGTAYVLMPTVGLWYANRDDKEIRKWRKTQVGKSYWFVRDWNGEIMRFRKPHIIGQMFGTVMEEALDEAYAKDGQFVEAFTAMFKDAAVNMLPLFGVIPASILADKDFSQLGDMRPITPEADKGLDRQYQGRDRASLPARIVSDMTRNVLTPAQTQYLINTVSTTVGADFVQGVTAAHEYAAYGFVPAKYETPVIRSFYQNLNARPEEVYKFYKHLEEIEPAANTVKYLSQPGNLIKDKRALTEYYNENIKKILLFDTFSEARKDINNYRRAVADLDKMKSLVTQPAHVAMKEAYLNMIEQRARSANLIAEQMLKDQ